MGTCKIAFERKVIISIQFLAIDECMGSVYDTKAPRDCHLIDEMNAS